MDLLSTDSLLHVFSFLNAVDLKAIALTSRGLRQTSRSTILWKELCRYTGKVETDLSSSSSSSSSTGGGHRLRSESKEKEGNDDRVEDPNFFIRLYYNVPCVPVDFPTINEALTISPPGTTITIRPGIYEERLIIEDSVKIRASDPTQGAALVWYQPSSPERDPSSNEASSSLSSSSSSPSTRPPYDNESLIEIEESCTYVSLKNLTLLHYSEGTDLWDGNCAVYCHGDLTHTSLEECSIQSDSGRGIVVKNGAEVILIRSSIHDCAATGVYVGGDGSIVDIISSNILRNGFGRRPLDDVRLERMRPPGTREGHSGLYIEQGDVEIRNTLIAENCLTGMSVVRGGSLHLSHSVFVGNGADHILVYQEDLSEDENDDDDHNGDDEDSLRGMIEHSNVFEPDSPNPETMRKTLIRSPTVCHRRLSRDSLLEHLRPPPES